MTPEETARLRELRYKDSLTKKESEELNNLADKEAEAFKKDPTIKLSNGKE